MCCIFTCCGWVIDLVQRCWTFTMACCIAGAVCCVLMLGSMSGVALGYNYSLAEYIDLKETNVSVYLKRGIFDDDIVDDMEWRRSGHLPVKGLINEDNLVTAAQNPEAGSLRAGRRLDDSIFESDDHHGFEGSLMKLTAKPPYQETDAPKFTDQPALAEMQSFAPDSLNQIKALQSIINRRKMDSPRYSSNKLDKTTTVLYAEGRTFPEMGGMADPRRMMMDPMDPLNGMLSDLPRPVVGPGDSQRLAVPDQSIGDKFRWMNPRLPSEKRFTLDELDALSAATFPPPVTPRPGPLRPTRPPPPHTYPTSAIDTAPIRPTTTAFQNMKRVLDDDLESFKDRLLLSESPERSQDFLDKFRGSKKSDKEDYDDDVRGLPVRRKRHVYGRSFTNNNDTTAKDYTAINMETEVHNFTKFNNTRSDVFNANRNLTTISTNNTNFKTSSNNTNTVVEKQVTTQARVSGLLNKLKTVFSHFNYGAPRKMSAIENNDTKPFDFLVLFD